MVYTLPPTSATTQRGFAFAAAWITVTSRGSSESGTRSPPDMTIGSFMKGSLMTSGRFCAGPRGRRPWSSVMYSPTSSQREPATTTTTSAWPATRETSARSFPSECRTVAPAPR